MNTINTNLQPSNSGSLGASQQSLGRSLVNLSARAQPAQEVGLPADDLDIGGDQYLGPTAQVALQNRFSALTGANAPAANQSATDGLGSPESDALGVQANLSPETVWGLLQQD